MGKFDSGTILITGGSQGIGFGLARKYAYEGHDILLVSISREELDTAYRLLVNEGVNTKIHTLEMDLSKKGSALEVYKYTKENNLKVNVLINCAGFGTYGFLKDIDKDIELNMLYLHICSVYELTRLFLKDMLKQDYGYIINFSSITAFQPNPLMATYGASKSFILQFSRAVSYELKEIGSNVKMTVVCPSAVSGTNFEIKAGMKNTYSFNSWLTLDVNSVVEQTYDGIKKGNEIIIPGRGFAIINSVLSILPAKWRSKIAYYYLMEKV